MASLNTISGITTLYKAPSNASEQSSDVQQPSGQPKESEDVAASERSAATMQAKIVTDDPDKRARKFNWTTYCHADPDKFLEDHIERDNDTGLRYKLDGRWHDYVGTKAKTEQIRAAGRKVLNLHWWTKSGWWYQRMS